MLASLKPSRCPVHNAVAARNTHVWRVLGHEAHAAVCCERNLAPPSGLAGGCPGAPMRLWLELPDGSRMEPLGDVA